MVNFERHVVALAAADKTQTGQRTRHILAYMVHGGGTNDFLLALGDAGALNNQHGVATEMDEVNRFLVQSMRLGVGGNKADACDVEWHLGEWLRGSREADGDLQTLQRLAVQHGRNTYLEFCVMGGDGVDGAVCGQWAIDMVLGPLCDDVGLSTSVLLGPTRRCYDAPAATDSVGVSTIT